MIGRRNSKSEIRNKLTNAKRKLGKQSFCAFSLPHLSFCFGFRISNFGFESLKKELEALDEAECDCLGGGFGGGDWGGLQEAGGRGGSGEDHSGDRGQEPD